MDYPRCAYCKHFRPYAADMAWGNCTLITSGKRRDAIQLDPESTGPGIVEGKDWERVEVDVHHELFGCILHETKE